MISLATVTEPSSNESLDQATLINLSNPPPIPLTPTESEIIVRVKSSSSVGSDTSERENIEIIQDALVVGLDEMLPSAFRRGVIDTRGAEDCNESINVSNCPGLIGRVQDSSDEMDQVDNPGGYLRCPHQCNKSFDNAREWKAHALTHFRRERPPPTATCPFRACREKFESGNNHENWEARMNHVEKFHYAKQKNPISETDKDLSDLEEQDNDLIYWTVEYDPASSNHRARAGDGRISEPRAPEYPNFSSGQPHPADVQAGSSNTYYTCMRNTSTGRVREERRHS